jgi:hypothetical protein
MRKLLAVTIATLFICAASVMAAVPQQINYQGYLTDVSGSALDTTVAMTFRIYADSVGGAPSWYETHGAVAVVGGLFDVKLGSVSPLSWQTFWTDTRWLGITVGTNSEMVPRTRFVTVPYAFRVATVDGASGGNISSSITVTNKANIGESNMNPGEYAFVAGYNNSASGDRSTIGGGSDNEASDYGATVSGGVGNLAEMS